MTWLVDGRTFARKVKNPTDGVSRHGGRSRSIECPSCGYVFDQSNVTPEWPGLPAGVKFDPSDQELLDHLAAKVGLGAAKPHPFMDEFIPTLDGEDGICYTHPEKLPGIRRDGSSIHFFHRPARAYTTGTRKRRKIQSEHDDAGSGGEMRWHKTGKTRPVVENGKQLGCKKIMVLYISFGKKAKPDKTNWVMHQYHLGLHEEEKDGELVVSKVFYQTQPRQSVGLRRGDDDNFEQVELELAEGPAHSFPQSSTSNITTSINSRGTPLTPKTPALPRPQTGKQHKGLLETISEDVDRINASLTANAVNMNLSPEQSVLAPDFTADCKVHLRSQSVLLTDFTSSAFDCRSDFSEQTAGLDLVQGSTEQGEQDTCCSLDRADPQNACEAQSMDECIDGLQTLQVDHLSDVPALGSQQFSDSLDTGLMKLLCDENLQADSNFKSKNDAAQSFKSIAADVGFRLDSMQVGQEVDTKVDSDRKYALENIVLDTPPDLLLESLMNSQETSDWLGKRKFWSDSQKTSGSDDLNTFDFLRDSQSST